MNVGITLSKGINAILFQKELEFMEKGGEGRRMKAEGPLFQHS